MEYRKLGDTIVLCLVRGEDVLAFNPRGMQCGAGASGGDFRAGCGRLC